MRVHGRDHTVGSSIVSVYSSVSSATRFELLRQVQLVAGTTEPGIRKIDRVDYQRVAVPVRA
jgi:hypothetical protein